MDESREPGLTWAWLDAIAAEHGDAFYLFDPQTMRSSVAGVRAAFADVAGLRLAFSYKTNTTPAVCRVALDLGLGAEVASHLEFDLARRLGVPGPDIVMSGVSRGQPAVSSALSAGALLVVDGDRDADLTMAHADAHGGQPAPRVLLRVRVPTPDAPTPRLGMTPEHAVAVCRRLREHGGIDVVGLHAHVTDRSVAAMQARIDTLARVADDLFETGPQVIDLGGSLPSVAPCDAAREFAPYAQVVCAAIAARDWQRTEVILEPGNAVIARAISLVARVLDVREQPDRIVATVAASVHHSSPIRRRVDFPTCLVSAPGATRIASTLPVHIAGSTLIDGDWLALDLPWSVAPGDFVVLDEVGAYSITLDNSFIEPPLPVVVREADTWSTARHRPGFDDAFAGFVF